MKVVAIIQSRMSSTRLPGKALLPLAGKPLTEHVVHRVSKAERVHEVVLALPDEKEDDVLVERLESWKEKGKRKKEKEYKGEDEKNDFSSHVSRPTSFVIYRGSLKNVQNRFYKAAIQSKADIIIRVTGDNPLIEPSLIDALIERWEETKEDYLGCADCITGLGSELFTMKAFERAVVAVRAIHELPLQKYSQEHVTPIFYQNPDQFQCGWIKTPEPFCKRKDDPSELSFTVDTQEHYDFMKKTFEKFYCGGEIDATKVIKHLRKKQFAP